MGPLVIINGGLAKDVERFRTLADRAIALGEPTPDAAETLRQMGLQVVPMHARASR